MIKFRAWDKLTDTIQDVLDINFIEKTVTVSQKGIVWYKHDNLRSCEDVILMQSTGVEDKNGVEIFEGDIVRRARPCKSEDEIMHIGFANGSFYTTFFPDWCRTSLFSYIEFGNQVEIIGNIYEQPELLGGAQ